MSEKIEKWRCPRCKREEPRDQFVSRAYAEAHDQENEYLPPLIQVLKHKACGRLIYIAA